MVGHFRTAYSKSIVLFWAKWILQGCCSLECICICLSHSLVSVMTLLPSSLAFYVTFSRSSSATALFLSLCICQCLWLGVVSTDMIWVCDHWSIYFYSDIWKQREVSAHCLDDIMKCEANSLVVRIFSPVSGRSGAVSLTAAWHLHLRVREGKKERGCLHVY